MKVLGRFMVSFHAKIHVERFVYFVSFHYCIQFFHGCRRSTTVTTKARSETFPQPIRSFTCYFLMHFFSHISSCSKYVLALGSQAKVLQYVFDIFHVTKSYEMELNKMV
jgi:hypothetical protein